MSRFRPASAISPFEHHTWASKVWKRMDRDMSGFITRAELDCEEFHSIIRSLLAPGGGVAMGGAHYARAEMNMNQAINFCLRKADLNQDTTLSFDEFKAFMWCLRQEHQARDTASMIFALFDLDQDNLLSESEFREVCRFYLGHKPTEVEFQEEWGRLDQTARRQVTRAEYVRWLQTSGNPVFKQHAPPAAASDARGEGASPSGRLPRLGRSERQTRPLWNHRLDVANPGVRQHISLRTYFSRPQSLPELSRHYQVHRGFRKQHQRLLHHIEPHEKKVLSTDRGYEFHPARALPGGSMRCRSSGKLEAWEDHWQTPLCMKPKHRSGTLSLRASEPPPRWMLDYKSDFELPRPTPSAAGQALPLGSPCPASPGAQAKWSDCEGGCAGSLPGALLLIGSGTETRVWAADALCAPGWRALGPAGLTLGRGCEALGPRAGLVLEMPGIVGSAGISAAQQVAVLEQCLLDEAITGGVAGILVLCSAAGREPEPGARAVAELLQRGLDGDGRSGSVILCGTELGGLGPEALEAFEADAAGALFRSDPGLCSAALALSPRDPDPLLAAARRLPRAGVCYRRPAASELADALASDLGLDRDRFAAELELERARAVEVAGRLQQSLPPVALPGEPGGEGRGRVDELVEPLPCPLQELSLRSTDGSCTIS